jgi:hypothetical protein
MVHSATASTSSKRRKKLRATVQYHVARVYRGKIYTSDGQWGANREVQYSFQITEGQAHVKRLNDTRVGDDNGSSLVHTYLIVPISDTVTIMMTSWWPESVKYVTIYKYNGVGKSLMYKMRL